MHAATGGNGISVSIHRTARSLCHKAHAHALILQATDTKGEVVRAKKRAHKLWRRIRYRERQGKGEWVGKLKLEGSTAEKGMAAFAVL
ncbi:hypothetical protein E2542_SST06721 [Spatholobus suberectus]|nr:hypothetical protein E2542_SST06721 [Spatholobus suberectus]